MSGENNTDLGWEALFYPASVAVIGASADPAKPGGDVLANLQAGGFRGPVYPVNPGHRELGGWRCFPEISAVPGPVDLAVISVRTPFVLPALEECAASGVAAAVVFSSGFGETGEAGVELQRELGDAAGRLGLRLCGPNTMGLANYLHRLHAYFAYGYTASPRDQASDAGIALISQSGGIGCSMLTSCAEYGLGVAFYVSSGNEAATDFADYMAYFVRHPGVKFIAAYLEGIRDGEKLARAADLALAAGKPVVVLKTGGNEASARAARSHTGSLAGSAAVYRAFFRQKGIIEVQNIGEMTAVLSLLAAGRRPAGNRVAILASSGGHAVVAADKCAAAGLEVVPLGRETRRQMVVNLPSFAATANPVDFTGLDIVRPGLFMECAAITAADPAVDALLLLHWLSAEVDSVRQLQDLAGATGKPLAMAGIIHGQFPSSVLPGLVKSGVACLGEVEAGARALANVARYEDKCKRERRVSFASGANPPVTGCYRSFKPGTLLGEHEVKKLLGAYGIPVVPEVAAATADEAVEAAEKLGYPVVVKVDSPDIAHKTEVGGVRLNLTGPEEVRFAFTAVTGEAYRRRPGAVIRGVLVQEMLRGGVEVLVGLGRDPVFGLTLTCGLGGIWVEVLRDVSLRVLPVTDDEIREMIQEIKAYPLLAGARGRPAADLEALVGAMRGVAQLGLEWPELAELDINPLYVLPAGQGAYAVDAMAAV
ncbi:MAG TPA: acetate--CoA ligase family protein [Spirochaetia bacterium]|nr:acetate--CoA ligase family protein [Spirochaetia bacterium]